MKKKYWELRYISVTAKSKWFLWLSDDSYHLSLELSNTIRKDYKEKIRVKIVKKGEHVDFFLIEDIIPCISKELGELIQEYGRNDIQRIPIEISESNYNSGEFEILKVLKRLDCIDLEKSEIRYHNMPGHPKHGEIACLQKVILDTSKTGENHIFKISKIDDLNESIYVSDELKQEIEKRGFTGIRFVRV